MFVEKIKAAHDKMREIGQKLSISVEDSHVNTSEDSINQFIGHACEKANTFQPGGDCYEQVDKLHQFVFTPPSPSGDCGTSPVFVIDDDSGPTNE